MKKIKLGLVVIVLNLTGCTGFYSGIELGATNLHQPARNVAEERVGPNCTPRGCTQVSVDPSNQSFGGRFFLGGGCSRYFSTEMGFGYYGAAKYNVPTPGPDPDPTIHIQPPCNTPSAKVEAVDIVAKVKLPILPCITQTQGLDLFGKFGAAYVVQSLSGSLSGCPESGCSTCNTNASNNGLRPVVGVGIDYHLNQNLRASLTATRIISGGGSIQPVDFVALGLAYEFVDRYCGQFLCD